jgi:hypothetical protein
MCGVVILPAEPVARGLKNAQIFIFKWTKKISKVKMWCQGMKTPLQGENFKNI